MAKYKAYPEYKDSGVEWLGEIPAHWRTISIARLFSRNKRTGYTGKELLSVYRDYGVIPKSSRDDNNNKPSEDLSSYQLVKPDDLVMNKMKAWQGSIAISEYEGIVSPAYFIYQPNEMLFKQAYPKYIHYLLRNPIYVTQYLSRSKGIRVNQWDLDPDEFRNIEILLPRKSEQSKIFSFLDHETAKIDNLIEKQQQLIELLKEKREAVISHAVTKGLNPDVPMKDSGVEYQQKKPLHWTLNKFRYMFNFDKGLTITKENLQDEGIPCINYGEIHSKYHFEVDTKIHKLKCVNESYIKNNKNSLLYKGDIIFADTSEDIEGAGNFSQLVSSDIVFAGYHTIIARLYNRENYRYYAYLLNSQELRAQIRYSVKGVKVYSITQAILRNISCWLPSSDEQNHIAKYLDQKITKIDTLIEKQHQQIELLQERRTALISAAVTGKIDVRNWRAPTDQPQAEAIAEAMV
ncbi:restriction endonuclease subunit S [Citrobacter amalonaticus]|uniref:restriction endonuclease subunit S n=1 Tax=Citrobacter amalonaticus TaxID=35703 RepID=UPI00300DA7A3